MFRTGLLWPAVARVWARARQLSFVQLSITLMALGIFDAVTDGDLTRGHYVAGTGTLSADGTVGPIGGAAEKALAAEADGAKLFLVPRLNEQDARRWVRSIQVVPIERFEDGINALCGLEPSTPEAAETTPPPCARTTRWTDWTRASCRRSGRRGTRSWPTTRSR